MKRYLGNFVLYALSLTLGEYNSKRGWQIPEGENPDAEGYMTETEEGHISWQPKDVFEKHFKEDVETDIPADASELTFGMKAVGIGFNPSGNQSVYECKKRYADQIDQLNDFRNDPAVPSEAKRLASIAITEAQGAQMWAVKALTWTE